MTNSESEKIQKKMDVLKEEMKETKIEIDEKGLRSSIQKFRRPRAEPEIEKEVPISGEDIRYLKLLDYFGVKQYDVQKDDMLERELETIWRYGVVNSPNNNINEIILAIRKLDNQLGVPLMGMKKSTQIYQYIRLNNISQSLHTELKEIEESKGQLKSK